MMLQKFKKKNFGGDCPKFTMPPVMVGGGFTLIAEQAGKIPEGWVIPTGTLAMVDESKREATLVTTGRVTAISTSNNKQVTLQADGAAAPMSAQERNNLYTTMANEAFDEEERK